MRLRLGTRGSALALWQARHTAAALASAHPGVDVEIVVLKTEGDRFADAKLTASGGKGVFVREIEDAIRGGAVDAGVHSLKDLPTEESEGLEIAAVLPRGDPRDALVARGGGSFDALARGAVVATGSPRRRGQLLHARPDLSFVDVRGNVDTRIRKLEAGEFDALVLAAAGLTRLEVDPSRFVPLPVATCLPAPGQGAIAIQARAEDPRTRDLLAGLEHRETRAAVTAEREFLRFLGAGCLAPAGALARVAGERLTIEALVATVDGTRIVRDEVAGDPRDAAVLGAAVAAHILDAGGDAIVRESR